MPWGTSVRQLTAVIMKGWTPVVGAGRKKNGTHPLQAENNLIGALVSRYGYRRTSHWPLLKQRKANYMQGIAAGTGMQTKDQSRDVWTECD